MHGRARTVGLRMGDARRSEVEWRFRFVGRVGSMVPVATEAGAPRRADAIRNRALVLAAAEEVFAEQGLRAQVEEVARRAGVGVGTVCRNFATKQALLQAVLSSLYESLLARAEDALTEPDPAVAFEAFVLAYSEFSNRHRAFAEQMANELEAAAQPVRARLLTVITQLVANAQAVGAIRPDVGPTDVSMLLSGVAHATALAGDLQPRLRERYVRIVLDGLRPHGASELPGQPLSFAEVRRAKHRRRAAR